LTEESVDAAEQSAAEHAGLASLGEVQTGTAMPLPLQRQAHCALA
jgi:hypothetical protein